jgi:hypothetical protein
MPRSISFLISILILVFCLGTVASAQDFILQTSDPAVVKLSAETKDNTNVFEDRDGDGIYDGLTLNGRLITGNIKTSQAQGFRYEDGRYIVVYPTSWTGLPKPGNSELLGFIHYFDKDNLSTYLAIVGEQAVGDDTTHGFGVFFYDSSGLRVGAPTSLFMEKASLRALPIYQEWTQMGLDFGIGSNPINSQFFVYAKDLGLTDVVLIVTYQLYQ